MEVVRAANLCPAVLRLSRFHHTLCGSQSMILFRANCCNLYGHIARNNIIKLAVTKSVVKSGEIPATQNNPGLQNSSTSFSLRMSPTTNVKDYIEACDVILRYKFKTR